MHIEFATQSYQNASLPISAQQVVNAYAEREPPPPETKTPIAVKGCPGLTSFATLGTGPIRGFVQMQGIVYLVSGNQFYSLAADGTSILLGQNIGGTAVTPMSQNGSQIIIVNGVNGYIYDLTTGFDVITDSDFHAAKTVTFFDNYFVFDWDGTARVFLSGLLDGASYSGLDFATAEVQPQFVQATVNQQESLLVFSTGHAETWYDAGTVNFPFQRIASGTIERGLVAPLATVKEDNAVFFLGDDLVFYRLEGVLPKRLSTFALEEHWGSYSTVTDAFCFSYTTEGHKWVVLTFPSGNATFVYDISSGLWHERVSYDQFGNNLGRWRGNAHIRAYGKDLIGDAFNGTVGYVDVTTAMEYDNLTPTVMVSAPTDQDRKRLFYANFELDIESGVGLTSGQGIDPQAMLRWSNDGSRTWSLQQKWRSMGRQGEYLKRLRWAGVMGAARQRTWKLEISDPVRRTILSARCDVRVGL